MPNYLPLHRRAMWIAVALAMLVSLFIIATPASAAENTWYRVPGYRGTVASAIVDSLHVESVGNGRATGRIWLRKDSGSGLTYVQFKADPRGPGGWTRGTRNHNVASGAHVYSWSKSFWVYTTGFRFRICKVVKWRPDNCGSSVLIEGSGRSRDATDVTAPTVSAASVSLGNPADRAVQYTLTAADDNAVTQRRVAVNGVYRDWVAYASSGTVMLPDRYGTFGVKFQVKDAAGNVSSEKFAGSVARKAAVNLALVQTDNNGNVRSCGSIENPCSDVVKRFRTSITAPILPDANLLLKAWRNIDGSWVETSTSPFMYEAIDGRSVIGMQVTASLMAGIWRFQTQVPTTGTTQFGASEYQYLRID